MDGRDGEVVRLGPRLKAAADFVPPGSRLADIGTDHARLPIDLLNRGVVAAAVAGEVNSGPWRAACESVRRAGLAGRIDVRLGDGLSILKPGEVDVAVIAGMGGATITSILRRSPAVAARLKGLALQPQNAAAPLREWLAGHGWRIADEELAEEEGRLYEIIWALPGRAAVEEAILFEIGPCLWAKRHKLLGVHLEALLARDRAVLTAMSASASARRSAKYRLCEQRIQELEMKRACL